MTNHSQLKKLQDQVTNSAIAGAAMAAAAFQVVPAMRKFAQAAIECYAAIEHEAVQAEALAFLSKNIELSKNCPLTGLTGAK